MTVLAPTDLALQVEVPPASPYLANMIANPDGRFGGWFWVTEFAGMVSSPSTGVLRLTTGPAVGGSAGGMKSHVMPLKAGQYVRAAWSATLTPGTILADGYQAAFYYYNTAGALITTSPTKLVTANGAQTMDHTAPTGTVAVRLFFSTVRTDVNATLDFTGLKMARAATAAALDYIDPEPVTWATITSAAGNTIDIAREALNTGTLTAVVRDATLDPTVTGGLRPGRKVRLTATYPHTATTGANLITNPGFETDTAGWESNTAFGAYTPCTFARTNTRAHAGTWSAEVTWPDATATAGKSVFNTTVSGLTVGKTYRATFKVWVPVGAPDVNAEVIFEQSGPKVSAKGQWVDATVTWVANATSRKVGIRTLAAVAGSKVYVDSATFHEVTTTTYADPVFTGEVTDVDVAYTKPKTATDDPVGTITLVAVDGTALLAATAAPAGVGVLSELPHVLEGGKVPWNVAGNTGHVAIPAKLYTTDDATALDQVSVTCMTYHAHAYVNPRGVLTINTAPPVSGVVLSDVAEPSYVGIDVGFSTDECVNSVKVDKITQDAGGATITDSKGPFEDYDSIEEWNRRAATYTIQCVTGAGGKSPAGFAAEVLAANKTPTVKVRGFTFLVDDTTDLPTALAMDLTHLVYVIWQGTTYSVRVAAVRHTITARPDAARPVAWHTTITTVLPGTTNLPVHVPTP